MARKVALKDTRNIGIMAHIDAGKQLLLKEFCSILEKFIK